MALAAMLAVAACSDTQDGAGDASTDDGGPPPDAPYVELGVPDEVTQLEFTELSDGGLIPLMGGGQAPVTIRFAIKTANVGDAVFIEVVVTDPASGAMAVKEPLSRPDPLVCGDDGFCYKSPLYVRSDDLGEPSDLDGLAVHAVVRISDAERELASDEVDGVLDRR